MTRKSHGQLRRGQVITTYGPGALIDLPRYSAIVGGLDTWTHTDDLVELVEPRLTAKLQIMTGVAAPKLYLPPAAPSHPGEPNRAIVAWQFPEWFVVQERSAGNGKVRSRRLVHRRDIIDRGMKYEGLSVVATRFVRACSKGHIDDLNWYGFVHEPGSQCRRQLWLDEQGTTGDLSDLVVRCECKKSRKLHEASVLELNPLGTCRGKRPWLGNGTEGDCKLPSRLLNRTASNAHFSQVVSVLSLPDRQTGMDKVVSELWSLFEFVDDAGDLAVYKKQPKVTSALAPYNDEEVVESIQKRKAGPGDERPVKQVELDAILAAPEGYGDDVPVDPNFHARKLPDHVWRHSSVSDHIEAVIQLHRLREVMALMGFSRFEAAMPDVNGEYETDVERADLAIDPSWFPAVENRGEGIFLQLREEAVGNWLGRPEVEQRLAQLETGHTRWADARKSNRLFPGGPYVLLHTLSHLLIQTLAMHCGYPASSIKERIYAEEASGRYGILLYTGSPDAEGTLGGLVQQARYIEDHLGQALQNGTLCSNDPICAQHSPGESMEQRWLHGASCHGCALVAETSCEMRNDYLDRGLVVPILGVSGVAFFEPR